MQLIVWNYYWLKISIFLVANLYYVYFGSFCFGLEIFKTTSPDPKWLLVQKSIPVPSKILKKNLQSRSRLWKPLPPGPARDNFRSLIIPRLTCTATWDYLNFKYSHAFTQVFTCGGGDLSNSKFSFVLLQSCHDRTFGTLSFLRLPGVSNRDVPSPDIRKEIYISFSSIF